MPVSAVGVKAVDGNKHDMHIQRASPSVGRRIFDVLEERPRVLWPLFKCLAQITGPATPPVGLQVDSDFAPKSMLVGKLLHGQGCGQPRRV